MLQRVAASIDRLNEKVGIVIRWLVLLMVFIGAASAVLRYFSRGLELTLNLTPATEAQWYLFSVIFLLGGAYALHKDVHVRVDVMYERLGMKTRGWIDALGTIFFLVPLSVMML
ncbi:MAG: TRAP transporter small permease subunit, partial [Gemmatimonadetes bacterium]|nr:TRAP transporter small permease subunit [Gemmatimonadota bacterium]